MLNVLVSKKGWQGSEKILKHPGGSICVSNLELQAYKDTGLKFPGGKQDVVSFAALTSGRKYQIQRKWDQNLQASTT